jgi:hypothetical protein
LIWICFGFGFGFGGIFAKVVKILTNLANFDFFCGFRGSFEWIVGSKGMIIAAVGHISQSH